MFVFHLILFFKRTRPDLFVWPRSSNHPELALPYFDAILGALPLAKRRASRQPWPGGAHGGQPGLPGQQVDEFTIGDRGGYAGASP